MPCKIRISDINLDKSTLVTLLLSFTRKPDTMLLVQEHDPKDHYHVYLSDNVSLPTIRTKLKKHTPTANNDSYSVSGTHSDWQGYIGYLFKHEETTVIYNKMYDVESCRQYYKTQSTTFRKKTDYTIIFNFVEKDLSCNYSVYNIVKSVLKFYLKEQKIFHKAHIAQIVNTIYYQLHPDDESFLNSVLEEANIKQTNYRKVTYKHTSYFNREDEQPDVSLETSGIPYTNGYKWPRSTPWWDPSRSQCRPCARASPAHLSTTQTECNSA